MTFDVEFHKVPLKRDDFSLSTTIHPHHNTQSTMFATKTIISAALAAIASCAEPASFHVCNAGFSSHIGEYKQAQAQDGVFRYTNENGISVYRHNGYWYMGDMRPWPPVTTYRCVFECPKDEDFPPLVTFETNAKKGKDPAPILQAEPCATAFKNETAK